MIEHLNKIKLFLQFIPIATKMKHKIYRRLCRLINPISYQEAIKILKEKNFFLITSTGRTGTKWLSEVLGKSKGLYVPHEPGLYEQVAYAEALNNPIFANDYIEKFRLQETAFRAKNFPMYGEINGHLRRHLVPIRKAIPEIKIIHIIRDGRDFVRSVMVRRAWTNKDPILGPVIPHESVIPRMKWESYSRFEKICFRWDSENRYIEQFANSTIRFEDMLTDYLLFKRKILEVVGIEINEARWKENIQKKVNETRIIKFPPYEKWSESDKSIFNTHCEELMRKYKYI